MPCVTALVRRKLVEVGEVDRDFIEGTSVPVENAG
jgi:hypothetical protein